MRSLPLFGLMAVAASVFASPASAQTLGAVGVDTVRSGIGEESLAPAALPPQKPRYVTPTAVVSATDAAVAAPVEAEADPFVVKGVVATISATGFDRDAALEVAARQSMPGVLVNMGMEQVKADKAVKGLGNTMRFVKSYKVVKETLIPTYTLTTDLTFNGVMLQKNFGGKLPVAAAVKPAQDASSTAPVTEAEVPAASNALAYQWVVRISERDPAVVDKVRVNLNRQPGTKATYRLLSSSGAELLVETPMGRGDVSRAAGLNVDVIELEVPLPTAEVKADSRAWQGQDEPSAPAAPSAPGVPASPEGTY